MVPIADDRAISWCVDENELRDVLAKGDLFRGRLFIGRIKKWNMLMHWEYTKIEARYSWIGVEGLPLNFWDPVTFRNIGEACGGLMEVAPETMDQSFLQYANIKVKGFLNGFLNPIVEIPHENEPFHVGLFSLGLNPENIVFSAVNTKGLLARSVGLNIELDVKGQSEGVMNCTACKRGFGGNPEGTPEEIYGGRLKPIVNGDMVAGGERIDVDDGVAARGDTRTHSSDLPTAVSDKQGTQRSKRLTNDRLSNIGGVGRLGKSVNVDLFLQHDPSSFVSGHFVANQNIGSNLSLRNSFSALGFNSTSDKEVGLHSLNLGQAHMFARRAKSHELDHTQILTQNVLKKEDQAQTSAQAQKNILLKPINVPLQLGCFLKCSQS